MSDKFLLGFTLGVYFLWFVKHIIDAIDEGIKEKKRECTLKVAPMTNADRIRNMSDEELAEFLEKTVYYCRGRQNDKYCEECPLFGCRVCNGEYIGKWLQAEVEEGDADE